MNQPPPDSPVEVRPSEWRRPRGVAQGTWEYVHQRSIADHYDAFVADTPLCEIDQQVLEEAFPPHLKHHSPRKDAGRPATPPPVVLDLGCGTGRAALPLARRGYRVVGVDLSQFMLERLRTKVKQFKPAAAADSSAGNSIAANSITGNSITGNSIAGNSIAGKVAAVRANLVELGCFADGAADHAVCLFSTLGMIQGRRHRLEMLRHVARILRPDGRFVVHVHNRWAAVREPGGLRRLGHSWARAQLSNGWDFGDATYGYRGLERMFMHRFSKRELFRDLRSSGWRVAACIGLSMDGSRRCQPHWPLQVNCSGLIVTAQR